MTTSHSKQSRSRISRTSLSASKAESDQQSDTREPETAAQTRPVASFLVRQPPKRLPAPPAEFVATNASDYRGVTPKKAELAVLDDASKEIASFAEYEQVFYKAPPKASVAELYSAASQWTALRERAAKWDLYCRTQEGLAWTALRAVNAKLREPMLRAAAADPVLAAHNPSLVSLFSVGAAIGKRSAASRKAAGKKKAAAPPDAQPTAPTAPATTAAPVAQAPAVPAALAAGSTVH